MQNELGASASPTGPLAEGGAASASPAKPSVPSAESLPCIVCRVPLRDAFDGPSSGNQPLRGLEFLGYGHYGCTVFDMDPGQLIVNICDDCLTRASVDGFVRLRVMSNTPTDEAWTSPKAIARGEA